MSALKQNRIFGRAYAVWLTLLGVVALVGSAWFLLTDSGWRLLAWQSNGAVPILRLAEPSFSSSPAPPSPYPAGCSWRDDERTLVCIQLNKQRQMETYLFDSVTRQKTPFSTDAVNALNVGALSPDRKWSVWRHNDASNTVFGFTLATKNLQAIAREKVERCWLAWLADSRHFVTIGQAQQRRTFLELRDRMTPNAPPRRLYHPVLKRSLLSPVPMGFTSAGEAIAVDWKANPSANLLGVFNISSGYACIDFHQGNRAQPPIPEVPLVRFVPEEKGPFTPETRCTVRLPGTPTKAYVSLSPNARRIAYLTEEPYTAPLHATRTAVHRFLKQFPAPPDVRNRLFVSNSDGSGLQEVTPKIGISHNHFNSPDWLHDSRHVSFICGNILYKVDTGLVLEGTQ